MHGGLCASSSCGPLVLLRGSRAVAWLEHTARVPHVYHMCTACAVPMHSTAMAQRAWYVVADVCILPWRRGCLCPYHAVAWLGHTCKTQPWPRRARSLVAGVADSSWVKSYNMQVAKDTSGFGPLL